MIKLLINMELNNFTFIIMFVKYIIYLIYLYIIKNTINIYYIKITKIKFKNLLQIQSFHHQQSKN